jgi:RimJ/RimL family protein N-acetyltransferase
VIKGQNVTLRPATVADQRQIFEWLAQSDITSRMIGPPDFSDNPIPTWEEFMDDYNPEFFNDDNPDNGRSFIIETDGNTVGHINYNKIDRGTGTVELDIWLARSEHCNKGYGTDAINALCRYLNEQLDCNTLILAPSARNKAAIRAYEKCGFKPADRLPENLVPDYHDTLVLVKNG